MSASTYGSKSTPFTLRVMRSFFQMAGEAAPNLAGRLAFELFCTPMKRSATDFASTDLPAPEIVDVPFRRGTLRTYAWGTGPVVLGVHGWESSASRYAAFVELLVEAGFRVVLVDGHAHGASSGWRTNALIYGDGTKAVIDHIGPVFGLMAHSFGGATAISMLDRYPAVQVEKVVLIASVTHIIDALSLFSGVIQLPEPARRALVYHTETYARRSLRSMDVDHLAARRTEAALIIHDRDDRLTTYEGSVKTASVWPGAELHTTDGLGHRRILKDRDVISRVAAFLQMGAATK